MASVGKKLKPSGILKGSAIISFGGLISKILGAAYRIPLTNILGADGLGIYQTVFPVYCILLTFSSSGVPNAIAKLVSSDEQSGEKILKCSLKLFFPLGLIGSALMAALSPLISSLQGSPTAFYAYISLAPSVAAVAAISCLRGYFQGKKNMTPTAVSQVTEQATKLLVGISLCYAFGAKPYIGAMCATFAVSVSECVALLYLFFVKRKTQKQFDTNVKYPVKRLIAVVIPITLSAVALPLARFYDSFTIINFISKYSEKATALYGIYTGGVESVISVPIAICYGIAVAILPTVSSLVNAKKREEGQKKAGQALVVTLAVSTFSAVAVILLSEMSVNILFGSLNEFERSTTISLLRPASVCIILLSLVQTEASCLIAFGKTYMPCISLASGITAKIILQPFLLSSRSINIFAPLICDILCYFVAVWINLVYIIIYSNKSAREKPYEDNARRNRSLRRRFKFKGLQGDKGVR